ncbi:TOPRIM nucleotidyl transferase/hydrolase domain-containing protein, partial [Klebsiella pneumoniae]|uniref:TOPRIM nucleotidyl transferase/hydrolase domain-containing protein n=1 Tax=Klebsiella pneumoniae TaxID=573 RepID=UPI003F1F37B3
RFLDATKANLFFARGVLVVEGPGEALLLPALAEAAGHSLSAHGVSIVNVGDVGLYHYARIFQRAESAVSIGMPVACITDRDIVPTMASYVAVPKKKGVKRFEHDYDSA